MRAALALLGIAVAVGLGGCGPSKDEQTRKIARLERELRQAKAADALAQIMPLEVRTADFDKAISDAELKAKIDEFEAQRTRIQDLAKEIDAIKSGKPE